MMSGPTLRLPDDTDFDPWTVYTFAVDTSRQVLALNWEHRAYCWVRPDEIDGLACRVRWLADILAAVLPLTSRPGLELEFT
jgi:hypothetical protein